MANKTVTLEDIKSMFEDVDMSKDASGDHISREALDQRFTPESLFEMIKDWADDHFENFQCFGMEFAIHDDNFEEIYVMEYDEYWAILNRFDYKPPAI